MVKPAPILKVHIEFPNGQLVQAYVQHIEYEIDNDHTAKIKLDAVVFNTKELLEAYHGPSEQPPKPDQAEPVKRNTNW